MASISVNAFALSAFPEQLSEDARAVRDTAQVFGRASDGVFTQALNERERLRDEIDSGAAARQDAFNTNGETRALATKLQEGLGLNNEKRKEYIKSQLRGYVAQLAQELQSKNFRFPKQNLRASKMR